MPHTQGRHALLRRWRKWPEDSVWKGREGRGRGLSPGFAGESRGGLSGRKNPMEPAPSLFPALSIHIHGLQNLMEWGL